MATTLKINFHDILPTVQDYGSCRWLAIDHDGFAVAMFLSIPQLQELAADIIRQFGPLPVIEPQVEIVEASGQTADEKVELSVPPAEDEFLGEAEPPQEDRVTAVNPIRVEREDNSPEVPDHD
jgi:hypothetical protein